MEFRRLTRSDPDYPPKLLLRLGQEAPVSLTALGNLDILMGPKLALFCSSRCPGHAILRAYDHVQTLRKHGVTVISGFHSPMEKECLRVLLRGIQPLIICPARSLDRMRLPAEWKKPLNDRRLLLLSPFPAACHRVSAALAQKRNELVAALADEVFIAHVEPGGHLERLANRVSTWGVPLSSFP
jgi:predicted Rossmann fold nucleotide-binding protein DprA/Smf involved in DNA uptake